MRARRAANYGEAKLVNSERARDMNWNTEAEILSTDYTDGRGSGRGARPLNRPIADCRSQMGAPGSHRGHRGHRVSGLDHRAGLLRGGFWNLLWARELSNVSL